MNRFPSFKRHLSCSPLLLMLVLPCLWATPPVTAAVGPDRLLALWVVDEQDQWHANYQAKITSMLESIGHHTIPQQQLQIAMAQLSGYDAIPADSLFQQLPKGNQGLLLVRRSIKYVRKDDYYITARLLLEFRLYSPRGRLKTTFSANAVADELDNPRASEKAWTQLTIKLTKLLKRL